MFGMTLKEPTYMFCDDDEVSKNTATPEFEWRKKITALHIINAERLLLTSFVIFPRKTLRPT